MKMMVCPGYLRFHMPYPPLQSPVIPIAAMLLSWVFDWPSESSQRKKKGRCKSVCEVV